MRYLLFYICTAIYLLAGTSCQKVLEIGIPKDQIIDYNVYGHNESANEAMLSIYGLMTHGDASPYTIALLSGLAGDELTNHSNHYAWEIYVNNIDPMNNLYSNNFWSTVYSYIYQANAVYEGCSQSATLDPDVKKQLMAESLFVRAYWHFYLVNFYGDVPLAITTDYKKNGKLTRAPVTEVYKQIITDLKAAQADLNINYVAANSVTVSDERTRPNQVTATALLARVYLYIGNYVDAEAQATAVVNKKETYDLVSIDQVYLKNNREEIWALSPATNNPYNINTAEGADFILTSLPELNQQSTISPQLLDAFEKGDERLTHWVGIYTEDIQNPVKYFYPGKYRVKSGSDVTEYSVLFRLAEQYLIRAEAKAKLGKYSDAIADINVIKQRAGISLLSSDHQYSEEDLLQIIANERRVEFFAEQAHRWFDLKRTRAVDTVMSKVIAAKGGIWTSQMDLWPVPTADILANPNLNQNLGYD